jgi:hypothetical protein
MNQIRAEYRNKQPITEEQILDHNDTLIDKTLADPDFEEFSKRAYTSKRGYAIRVNPRTGQKEMFIAGTRSTGQHILNVWDGVLYGIQGAFGDHLDEAWQHETGLPQWTRPDITWFDPFRKYKTDQFEQIAQREGVDVIYGHSRGGAIVSDMRVDDHVVKVGLDSAMIIAENKDMVNYNEWGTTPSGVFDGFIGISGHDNRTKNLGAEFHHAWN